MMNVLLYALVAVAGAAGACQAAANAALAGRAGMGATLLVNTLMVLAGVAVLFVVTGGPRAAGAVLGAPLSHYVGGLCGFLVIASMTLAVPRVGTGIAVALMVLGQGAVALAIDHFGLWGMRVTPVSAPRLVGVGLLVAGLALMRR